jgi:hypothetical protein
MKGQLKVIINFDGIEFECSVKLNQSDNIDNGFEIKCIELKYNNFGYNFKSVLNQDQLIKLIHEQLKSSL